MNAGPRWRRRAASLPPPPGGQPGSEAQGLLQALKTFIRRVNASAGRLPVGAVPQIRAIEDELTQLLDHADERVRAGSSIDTFAMITIASTINDYLPTSVDTFLALPAAFLASHRNGEGQTPAEELLAQLRILHQGVVEVAEAVYTGDAQRLSTQGRFLDTKFSRSDLDL